MADRQSPDWDAWIQSARDAGLHAVAITDHNTAQGIQHLQSVALQGDDSPVLFPAVEATASDGIHLLLLLAPNATQQHVEKILADIDISVDDQGTQEGQSSLSILNILDNCGNEALILGAHVNGPKGILTQYNSGMPLINILNHPHLLAVEIDPEREYSDNWLDGQQTQVNRSIPQVWSSDSHAYDSLGTRFTWVKMTTPSYEGLRLALLDGDESLKPSRQSTPNDPNNNHANLAIESISVANAKYIGRREPVTVHFNPWLNTIIGGRGTGKSTIVDFCRKAFRREFELDGSDTSDEGSLRKIFDSRMSDYSKQGEGLATANTVVEAVYRKDGERFVVSWSSDGSAPAICRIDDDVRVAEDGNISELFPVRIYSQKQLFALAQDPNALLTVIDQSNRVNEAEIRRTTKQQNEHYLSLRAQARASRSSAENLPDRQAALRDVERKLNILQGGENAAILSEYRLRRQQDDAWRAILNTALSKIDAIELSATDLSVPDLELTSDTESDDASESLFSTHANVKQIVDGLKQNILTLITEAKQKIDEVQSSSDASLWNTAKSDSESRFEALSATLAQEGVASIDEYDSLLHQAASLKQEIARIEQDTRRSEELDNEAQDVLKGYRKLRGELSDRRLQFIDAETSGEIIRVTITPYGSCDTLRERLAAAFGADSFENDREAIFKKICPKQEEEWDWQKLDAVLSELAAIRFGGNPSWAMKDRRFLNTIRKATPESIDRLALYLPEDTVTVEYQDQNNKKWKDLSQGSPGQQTAALLAFVLGYGSEPIILDQPEDDLDNTLIYDLLVSRLREAKFERQVIVVTHNPNIVVHGDAELLISLASVNGRTKITRQGGLQEEGVREEICRVMEGGREAFERRYQRIMTLTGT
ncbi:MAG: AAA family ATPase [bacterium]|nr:AAA family ATPase [bacterium]